MDLEKQMHFNQTHSYYDNSILCLHSVSYDQGHHCFLQSYFPAKTKTCNRKHPSLLLFSLHPPPIQVNQTIDRKQGHVLVGKLQEYKYSFCLPESDYGSLIVQPIRCFHSDHRHSKEICDIYQRLFTVATPEKESRS